MNARGTAVQSIGDSRSSRPRRRSFLVAMKIHVRKPLNKLIRWINLKFWGMDIGHSCLISLSAKLDHTNPKGLHIGSYTSVAFHSTILTHDYVRRLHMDTWIGERCLIGACSIIMPGIKIGDGCIIGAGSVVMTDVPPGCMVMGNPARIIERNIQTGPYGIILSRENNAAAAGNDGR